MSECYQHGETVSFGPEGCPKCIARIAAEADPVAARRASEAALVALVAAVPEGLDPVGWRAAVLAFAEEAPPNGPDNRERAPHLGVAIEAWIRIADKPSANMVGPIGRNVLAAYRRALAPVPKVQPERRVRERGPVVVVDRGEE